MHYIYLGKGNVVHLFLNKVSFCELCKLDRGGVKCYNFLINLPDLAL